MRLKILIVEDDLLQATVLARTLQAGGAYAEMVHNGLDAIRRVHLGIFDAVLIDYRMPHVNGVTVAKIIQGFVAPHVRPRLIALTATPAEVRALAPESADGFDAIVAKPFTLEGLMATINACRGAAPARVNQPVDLALLDEAQAPEGRVPEFLAATEDDRPRAVVAEDDALLCAILQQALQDEGFAVDKAANGLETLRLLRSRRYDVALLDYKMPELDGLATAKLIYDLLGRNARPRLIALTAAIDDMFEHDPRHGILFDAVVTKAQGILPMLAAVRRSLDYRRLRQAAPEAARLPGVRLIVDELVEQA